MHLQGAEPEGNEWQEQILEVSHGFLGIREEIPAK